MCIVSVFFLIISAIISIPSFCIYSLLFIYFSPLSVFRSVCASIPRRLFIAPLFCRKGLATKRKTKRTGRSERSKGPRDGPESPSPKLNGPRRPILAGNDVSRGLTLAVKEFRGKVNKQNERRDAVSKRSMNEGKRLPSSKAPLIFGGNKVVLFYINLFFLFKENLFL